MARFPLAQRFTHRRLDYFDYEYELRRELGELYPDLEDLRDASIADLWQIARDLTLAIDRLARKNEDQTVMTGEQKMELALDVIRSFIEVRGGPEALHEVIAGRSTSRFGRFRRWISRWVLTPDVVEWAIRGVLEFAVAELKQAAAKI